MTGRLFTAEDVHHEDPKHPGLTPPERILARYWPHFESHGLPATGSDTPAFAIVNHNRWIVRCPWCTGAQNASRTDHRFFCNECSNNGEGWVTVTWPENADEIEAVLGRRPNRKTRNWLPHESADDLRAENEAHGVL